MQSPVPPPRPPLKLSIPATAADGGAYNGARARYLFPSFGAAARLAGMEQGMPPACQALIQATRTALVYERTQDVGLIDDTHHAVLGMRVLARDIDGAPETYEGVQMEALQVMAWLKLRGEGSALYGRVLDVLVRLASIRRGELPQRLPLPLVLVDKNGEDWFFLLGHHSIAVNGGAGLLTPGGLALIEAGLAGVSLKAHGSLAPETRAYLHGFDAAIFAAPDRYSGVELQAKAVMQWLDLVVPEEPDNTVEETDAELVVNVLESLNRAAVMAKPLDLSGAYSGAAAQLAAQGIDVGHKPAAPETDYRAISSLYGTPGGV